MSESSNTPQQPPTSQSQSQSPRSSASPRSNESESNALQSNSPPSNAPQSNAPPSGRVVARWTMPDAAPPPSLAPEAAAQAELRARRGLVLIAIGVLGVLWGVFHVLAALPTAEKLDFAHRMTDFQARSSVHENFPGGLARALIGLGVALWGGRMRASALRALGRVGE